MYSKDDTGTIIKDFLDLWQKQFASMTKDPEFITSILQFFQQSQESFFKSASVNNNVKPDSTTDISDNADDELHQLRQRIAYLEERLTEIESRAYGAGKKPAKAHKGKRPAGTQQRAKKSA